MGKIATRAFCNTLKAGAFSSELTRCPTKSEIIAAGFQINGIYIDNQLVIEEDIKNIAAFIVVGDGGYIDKIEV